jgi:Domain of unknown function (DUF6898)
VTVAGFAGVRVMPSDGHGVIFEMVVIGRYVKVTAVDTRSGIEASIVGDPRRGERALREAAARKLRYVMAKKDGGGTGRDR